MVKLIPNKIKLGGSISMMIEPGALDTSADLVDLLGHGAVREKNPRRLGAIEGWYRPGGARGVGPSCTPWLATAATAAGGQGGGRLLCSAARDADARRRESARRLASS